MEKIFHTGILAVMETSVDNSRLIFIHGIHSWTNAKMKEIYSFKIKKKKRKNLRIIFYQ